MRENSAGACGVEKSKDPMNESARIPVGKHHEVFEKPPWGVNFFEPPLDRWNMAAVARSWPLSVRRVASVKFQR